MWDLNFYYGNQISLYFCYRGKNTGLLGKVPLGKKVDRNVIVLIASYR